jgi:hypothetical protein
VVVVVVVVVVREKSLQGHKNKKQKKKKQKAWNKTKLIGRKGKVFPCHAMKAYRRTKGIDSYTRS